MFLNAALNDEVSLMWGAAVKALEQMFSRPFRSMLAKAAGLAVTFLLLAGMVLFRSLQWLSGTGLDRLEAMIGHTAHGPLAVFGWIIAIVLGIGLAAGAVLLVPAATALVAGFCADDIALLVERRYYPHDRPGVPLPRWQAVVEGARTALSAVAVYLVAAPLLLFAGMGGILFFLATAWLLGNEYFDFAAMRYHPPEEARMLRHLYAGRVFTAGLMIAGFVSIPILNLATPLFATALMVHVHKKLNHRAGLAPVPL
jgi:CysZ protein